MALVLYDNPMSGNCYKVRLLLAHLGLSYERVDVDVVVRDNREALLGDKNPAGRIPVLQLEDGRYMAESNAILWFLADGTKYLPEAPIDRAHVLQWMFFEQYSHEPYVAVARYIIHYVGLDDSNAERLKRRQRQGRRALDAMERHLESREFLVSGQYSIADIALYAYTHVADEAGIDLEPFPAIRGWLDRIREQPGHVELQA